MTTIKKVTVLIATVDCCWLLIVDCWLCCRLLNFDCCCWLLWVKISFQTQQQSETRLPQPTLTVSIKFVSSFFLFLLNSIVKSSIPFYWSHFNFLTLFTLLIGNCYEGTMVSFLLVVVFLLFQYNAKKATPQYNQIASVSMLWNQIGHSCCNVQSHVGHFLCTLIS